MPASIILDQVTLAAGVADKSRNDFVIGQVVTCTNATAESTYTWTLEDVPLRSALVRGTTAAGASFTFTPDVKGTYLVSLQVNGSVAAADNSKLFGAVLTSGTDTLGWRYPAAGEDEEDNVDRAGLGFPGNTNTRGWATDLDLQLEAAESAAAKVQGAVVTTPGAGVESLVKLDAVTGKLDPSVVVATRVLWTWNGVDLSQFDIAAPMLTPLGTMTPSVAPAVAPGPHANEINLTLAGFKGQQFYPIKNLVLPSRYVLRVRLHGYAIAPTASDNCAVLILSNNDPANLHGLQAILDNGGTAYIIEAGVRITLGTGNSFAGGIGYPSMGSLTEYEIYSKDGPLAVGAGPEFSMITDTVSSSNHNHRATAREAFSHAFAASWDGLTLNKAAFGMSTSNAKTGLVRVSDITFFKHPLDS